MPVQIGCSCSRSDTKHFAKCGTKSLRYCRHFGMYCGIFCEFGIAEKRKKSYEKRWNKILNENSDT